MRTIGTMRPPAFFEPCVSMQENKVDLPPDRFDGTNAELMRFCKACGLLEARAPAWLPCCLCVFGTLLASRC